MDDQGTMINPAYRDDPSAENPYKTGLIIQYSMTNKITKPDKAGDKLSDDDKITYPVTDMLNKANAKELAEGKTLDTSYTYLVSAISNNKYNNRNRIDKALKFSNVEPVRHLALCAYYYVWNTQTDEFEMSKPVYFYLYDIGNSVK